jgi:Leucine-rich repeat (LRR) protein
MTEAELGEWEGVTVDAEGRVVKLDLFDNNLAGALPKEIQQLSALTVLILSYNQLNGPIPAELGQLEALTGLWLNDNQLSGAIPAELALLQAPVCLDLSSNQLSGQEAFRSLMQEHNPECELVLVHEDYSDWE